MLNYSKIARVVQINKSSLKRSILRALYYRRRLGLKIPSRKVLALIWRRLTRHQKRPAAQRLRTFFRRYRRKRRPVFRRLRTFVKKFRRLRRAELRGRRSDYPASFERFRWPLRVGKTRVIDPAEIWEVVTKKSRAYEKIFRSYHRIPDHPTAAQNFILSFLWAFAEEYYSLPQTISLRAPPRGLEALDGQPLNRLFSVFWQPPLFVVDRDLLMEHFYAFKPKMTIWLPLVELLWQDKQTFFLWQFANRELQYWTAFLNALRPHRLTPYEYAFLQHPHWFRIQLHRLALALPFLPRAVRPALVVNFRRLARLCLRLHRRDNLRKKKNKNAIIAYFRPRGYARQRSWFIRQRFYWRRQRRVLRHRRHLINARRLRFLTRRYARLQRRGSGVPESLLRRSLGFLLRQRRFSRLFSFTSASYRLLRSYRCWHRQLRRQKRRQKKLAIRTRALPVAGPVFARYRRYSFFWSLLVFWLLAFFRRLVFSLPFYKGYRVLVADFASAPAQLSSWKLPWMQLAAAKIGRSSFRWACIHWVSRRKLIHRRRKYFRRRFRGFFYRFVGRRGRSRPIPRFYRRFKFIRRLPFRLFRVFWPLSANFTRLTGGRQRRLQRQAHRKWVPRGFGLVQPRAFVKLLPRWGGPRRQLVVGRPNNF